MTKTILVATIALSAFFGMSVAKASASTVFNTNQNDRATVRVTNHTLNPGCTTCWSSTANMVPGQVVAVTIYYHNTGTETAVDTRLRLSPQSTGTVSSSLFTGSVSAQNAVASTGYATAYVSNSPQTITYIPGTAQWYPDQSQSNPIIFSSAQEAALFGGAGVSIGNILPNCTAGNSFCHQGSLVAFFQVGNIPPPPACSIDSFSANPSSIAYNSSTTLSWATTSANDVALTTVNGNLAADGSRQVGPLTQSTTYTLTAHCSNGTNLTRTANVSVAAAPACYINSFAANPMTITTTSGTSTLSWTTTNGSYVTIPGVPLPQGNFVFPASGNAVTQTISTTTTFIMTVHCSNGSTLSRSVTVTVAPVQSQNYQCNDGFDNDTDGLIDFPNDPGCLSPTDNTEWNALPACNDGQDNDFDNLIDYPNDPGCVSPSDTNEYNTPAPACNNQIDDDQDGFIDYPQDPGCTGPQDTSEYNTPPSECNDQLDNDNDGLIDYPQDPGCTSVNDTTEYNLTAACGNGFDDDADGLIDFPQDPGCQSLQDTNEYNTPPIFYQCNNGVDDDGDGYIDYPSDTGCTTTTDNTEYTPPPVTYQCNNGLDDDNDGFIDYPADPGCSTPTDNSEYNVNAYVTVTTQPATNVQQASAQINGSYATSATNGIVWFEWGIGNSTGSSTAHNQQGGSSGSFQATLSNLAPNTMYSYRACAGAAGVQSTCGSVMTFNTGTIVVNNPPSVYSIAGSCNATPNSIFVSGNYSSNGNGTTQTYFVYGTNPNSLTTQVGNQTQNGTSGIFQTTISGLMPNTIYYFQAVAQNQYGTSFGVPLNCMTTGIMPPPPPPPPQYATPPQVSTVSATSVAQTSARVNGYLTSVGTSGNCGYCTSLPAYTTTDVWFDWGTTPSLGYTSTHQSLNGPSAFSFFLGSLAPNTTYYFRAMAQNGNGSAQGNILSFTTRSTGPQIIYVGGGSGTSPLVMLKIEPNFASARTGDIVTYTVTYKNLTYHTTLRDVVVQVVMPAEETFLRATRGSFSDTANTLTLNLGTLAPREEGSFQLETEINDRADSGETLVTTATLVYTHPTTKAQEDAIAYALVTVTQGGSSLAGLALFSGFTGSLLGILLVILLILLIVYMARRSYGPRYA